MVYVGSLPLSSPRVATCFLLEPCDLGTPKNMLWAGGAENQPNGESIPQAMNSPNRQREARLEAEGPDHWDPKIRD